jgi:peptidyl-prolyl cis-trans isomerase B (cyclophilin B)
MAKKKNSNYATAKRDEAKAAREAAEKKKKVGKILARVGIIVAAALVLAGIIVGLAAALGLFNYYPTATDHITMAVGDLGSAHIEVYGSDAPITAEHFKKLCTDKYFTKGIFGFHTYKDGVLYFGSHDTGIAVEPVEKPENDKTTYGIKGEFTDNGFENKITFTRGTIGIMHGEENNSGYGQFFIVLEDKAELDGKYAAFAKVHEDEGLDIFDKIVSDAKTGNYIDENGSIAVDKRVLIGTTSSHSADSHSH